MDDKINILVYVLFIAISIIGGIIQNANKKKAEEARRQQQKSGPQKSPSTAMPPISGPRETTNPFEEFLRRQLEQLNNPEEHKPEEEEPVYKPLPVEIKPERKPIPSTLNPIDEFSPMDKNALKEGEAAFESTAREIFSDNIYEKEFTLSNEIKDLEAFDYNLISKGELIEVQEMDFDISKAIVYSEILKRPAY
jgi:hypothetical protein